MTPKEAEKRAAQGDWQGAGDAYLELFQEAQVSGNSSKAAEYARLGADALRRDDRPAAAAKLLAMGREFGLDGPMDRLQLGAVLLDSGQVRAAVDIGLEALQGTLLTGDVGLEAVTRDALVGVLLVAGRVAEARRELRNLEGMQLPGAEISRRFREAQLARLEGQLRQSFGMYADLAGQLAPYKEAIGPLAACYQEQGEIRVLEGALLVGLGRPGAWSEAEGLFGQAAAAWKKAGRRAGLTRPTKGTTPTTPSGCCSRRRWRAGRRSGRGPGGP